MESKPHRQINQRIQRILGRYRLHVAGRTVLIGLLGAGCAAALLWRFHGLGLGRFALFGTGIGGLGALAFWQCRVIRRDWLASSQAALRLDRALRLKARLITATEFACVSSPPILYPILIQQTEQSLSNAMKHMPRIVDRWTLLLSAALAALLLFPWPRRHLQQLAMRQPSVLPPGEPPSPVPGDSFQQQTPQTQQSKGSRASSDEQSGTTASNLVSGESGQDRGREEPGAQSASTPSRSGQAQERQRPQGYQEAQADGGEQIDQGQKPYDSSVQPQTQREGSAREQARESQQRSAEASSDRSETSLSKKASTAKRSSSGDQARAGAQGIQQPSAQTAKETGSGQSASLSQDQLKADIQQLLKELSGELRAIQERLAAQNADRPQPMPGAATDPQLYEKSAALEKAAGSQLPIQLDVDTQPTSRTRPGTGVGEASEQASDAAPALAAEQAELSDQPTEESAIPRRRIPPEYRAVFERLSPTRNQQ